MFSIIKKSVPVVLLFSCLILCPLNSITATSFFSDEENEHIQKLITLYINKNKLDFQGLTFQNSHLFAQALTETYQDVRNQRGGYDKVFDLLHNFIISDRLDQQHIAIDRDQGFIILQILHPLHLKNRAFSSTVDITRVLILTDLVRDLQALSLTTFLRSNLNDSYIFLSKLLYEKLYPKKYPFKSRAY